eukprot:355422-Chlamydomonas_euryale.AAC.3
MLGNYGWSAATVPMQCISPVSSDQAWDLGVAVLTLCSTLRVRRAQVDAMELDKMNSPEMPDLLVEMGIKYDPERLKEVLSKRAPQVWRERWAGTLL